MCTAPWSDSASDMIAGYERRLAQSGIPSDCARAAVMHAAIGTLYKTLAAAQTGVAHKKAAINHLTLAAENPSASPEIKGRACFALSQL